MIYQPGGALPQQLMQFDHPENRQVLPQMG
jgi:hypothetical protein